MYRAGVFGPLAQIDGNSCTHTVTRSDMATCDDYSFLYKLTFNPRLFHIKRGPHIAYFTVLFETPPARRPPPFCEGRRGPREGHGWLRSRCTASDTHFGTVGLQRATTDMHRTELSGRLPFSAALAQPAPRVTARTGTTSAGGFTFGGVSYRGWPPHWHC